MEASNSNTKPAQAIATSTPTIMIKGIAVKTASTDANTLQSVPTATIITEDSAVERVETDANALHPADTVVRKAIGAVEDFAGMSAEAKEATTKEHDMTFMQAISLYRKGVMWSMLLSLAIIMEGYDVVLLQSLYAQKQFNLKYGVHGGMVDGSHHSYGVTASWKSALSNGALCGEVIGLFINGIVSERYGYKKTMIVSLAMMTAFIFIPFFAPNIQTLLVGEILCGIPWGVFQTLTCAYASEVTPVALRAYLCTYVNLCWVMGQLIASGVLRATLHLPNEWAYRIPFAIQWLWPVPIIIGVCFAPESPWWLIRKNRQADARDALLRLTTPSVDPEFNPDATISMIEHTTTLESQMSEGSSYLACFRGKDLRRTEIACVTWLVQTLCGSTFMGYSAFLYTEIGLPDTQAFNLSLVGYSLGVFGTFGSWFLMSRAGRRTIYLYGCVVLCLLLFIMGCTSFTNGVAANWVLATMLLLFTLTYDMTVGPVCYALVSEVSSTKLKAKTIVLARNLYNIGGIFVNVLTTYELTERPTGWGWEAKAGFFWAGSCFLCILWIFFRLPEPKGRTYGELDILFEKEISARKFKTTNLDIFRGDTVTPSATPSKVDLSIGKGEDSIALGEVGKPKDGTEVHVETTDSS